MAGDQHHRQATVAGLEPAEQLQAIHAGQADIADDDTGEIIADAFQRLLGAAHAFAGDVFQGQSLLAAQQHMGSSSTIRTVKGTWFIRTLRS